MQQVTHKLQHLHGSPGPSIVRAAEELNAGMIVCGSRGMGLIRRTILGSISDYVLHHAHIPVIVVKHDDEVKKIKTERQESKMSTTSYRSSKSESDAQ